MGGIKADLNNVLDVVKGLLNILCTPESEWKQNEEGDVFQVLCADKNRTPALPQ